MKILKANKIFQDSSHLMVYFTIEGLKYEFAYVEVDKDNSVTPKDDRILKDWDQEKLDVLRKSFERDMPDIRNQLMQMI